MLVGRSGGQGGGWHLYSESPNPCQPLPFTSPLLYCHPAASNVSCRPRAPQALSTYPYTQRAQASKRTLRQLVALTRLTLQPRLSKEDGPARHCHDRTAALDVSPARVWLTQVSPPSTHEPQIEAVSSSFTTSQRAQRAQRARRRPPQSPSAQRKEPWKSRWRPPQNAISTNIATNLMYVRVTSRIAGPGLRPEKLADTNSPAFRSHSRSEKTATSANYAPSRPTRPFPSPLSTRRPMAPSCPRTLDSSTTPY